LQGLFLYHIKSIDSQAGTPHDPPIMVPLDGKEYYLPSHLIYSILLPNPNYMEYIALEDGHKLPEGREPVPAGCEKDGIQKLYFASGRVGKTLLDYLSRSRGDKGLIEVPGKWGKHLGGVRLPYGGLEIIDNKYGKVLCWKKN
jgi:hypothetical protein